MAKVFLASYKRGVYSTIYSMALSSEKLIRITLSLLILFLPLIFIPSVYNPYEFPKFILFVAGIEVMVITFLFQLFSKGKPILLKIDSLAVLVICFGVSNLIADLAGINLGNSFLGSYYRHQGFLTLLCGIVLFLILRSYSLAYPKVAVLIRRCFLVSGFLVSLFAFWQAVQIHFFHNLSVPTFSGRIVGTMGNPNSLAGYIAMLLPFVISFRFGLIPKMTVFALMFIVIFFTDSRAAFLAAAFLFLVYSFRFFIRFNRPKLATGIVLILLFLGIFKFADFTIHKSDLRSQVTMVEERGCPESWPKVYPWKIMTDIYNSNDFFKKDSPCDNRLLIWTVGLEALGKRLFLGYGQENLESVIPSGKLHRIDNAHNVFIETMVSSGIIGLAFYLGILFLALKKASFDIKLSLLAFLIVAQFNPLSITQIFLFWILLGLI